MCLLVKEADSLDPESLEEEGTFLDPPPLAAGFDVTEGDSLPL